MAPLFRLLAGAIYLGWLPDQVPTGSWEAAVHWWLWGSPTAGTFAVGKGWKRMGHGGIKVYFFGCQSGFRNITNWFEQFLFTRQLQDWLTHANVDWGDLKRSESIAYLWNLSFDSGSFWILVTGLTRIVSFRDPPSCSRFLARNDDSSLAGLKRYSSLNRSAHWSACCSAAQCRGRIHTMWTWRLG